MTPVKLLQEVVLPGLGYMSSVLGHNTGPTTDGPAQVMLMAIVGQEAAFQYRLQIGGPARSYWQFEKGGGVAGVMRNATTGKWARSVCAALDIPSDENTVYEAMAWSDHLATSMARFNLWLAPGALPAVGREDDAYNYYVRQWAPGKPDKSRWHPNYEAAMQAVAALGVG